jgi:hypothetical protein
MSILHRVSTRRVSRKPPSCRKSATSDRRSRNPHRASKARSDGLARQVRAGRFEQCDQAREFGDIRLCAPAGAVAPKSEGLGNILGLAEECASPRVILLNGTLVSGALPAWWAVVAEY